MKTKILNILIISMWILLIASFIVWPFSKLAYWILYGLWGAVWIAIIVLNIFILIDIKKKSRDLDKQLERDRKHLEELIKGYLAIELANDNKAKEECKAKRKIKVGDKVRLVNLKDHNVYDAETLEGKVGIVREINFDPFLYIVDLECSDITHYFNPNEVELMEDEVDNERDII